jgi:predicted dehydrogenase
MHRFALSLVLYFGSLVFAAEAAEPSAKPLRAGIIGLDTSHVPAFTKIFNSPEAEGDVAGIRVVVGYPGGTDYGPSRDRVAKFTQGMRDAGVEIVATIPELLAKVDVVLLESVDGRIHLEEAIPVLRAGKPVFIDKPIAASLVDAIAIFELAKKHNVPCFSSSSLRYGSEIQAALASDELGEIVGAATWGPCDYQAGTPDLCFYGIHGVEALFTLMGRGCETVVRTQTDRGDEVVGTWSGQRIGSFRGIRKGSAGFGAVAFGSKSIAPLKTTASYKDLCQQIGRFFRTHRPPVDAETTIEIFAFIEAADESKRQGGKPIAVADVLAKGRTAAAAKLAALESK